MAERGPARGNAKGLPTGKLSSGKWIIWDYQEGISTYTGSPEKGHTMSNGPGSKERCQLHPELHEKDVFYGVALIGKSL